MDIDDLFRNAGLTLRGPIPWEEEVNEDFPGVYVVALREQVATCPISVEKLSWLNDLQRDFEMSRWISNQKIVYIGQTTEQTIATRIRQFSQHRYGAKSPHRGGQAVHLLGCALEVFWAPAQDPKSAEAQMLRAFMQESGHMPFANRKLPNTEFLYSNQMPNRATAVVSIGQLVSLAGPARPRVGGELGDLAIIEDAALLIDGDRIVAAGRYADVKSKIPADAKVIDAERRCVMPGFVDAHTHLVFAGNRASEFEQRVAGATYQEIAAAGGGILRTVALTRAASEDDLLGAARQHRDWMLRGGTTTLEAKSGYGLDRKTELKMLRVLRRLNEEGPVRIVATLLGAHTVPPEYKERRADYVRFVVEDLIPEVAAGGLAAYCDAFCDEHAFTVEETRAVLTAAKQHRLKLRVHAEQFRSGTGADLAAELGAATADHLETATDVTFERLRAAGVQPVLLPGSVFALGRREYPPARKMVDAGLAIVIATDFNPGSSPVPSIPFMMSLACVEMKLSPAEALSAVTINAAYSVGLGDKVGSIELGKQADFLIHEFGDYRELAYFVAAPMRPRVFIAGREVTP